MKKITLSIIAAFTFACAFTATNTATANQSAVEVSATDSKYEKVRVVTAYNSNGKKLDWICTLYKGVNTCDDYYVQTNYSRDYYAVRKNTNKDMSQYGYVFYDSSGTAYYFNF